MMQGIAALAAGGIAGTFGRALVSSALPSPWGTLAVNLSGCFLVGLFDSACARRGLGPQARAMLIAGFCGAYTTFSTLVLQLDGMMRTSPAWGVAYLLISVLAGLGLFRLGSAF